MCWVYLPTPWCRVLHEQLTGSLLVKKFPGFHGTRRFITALTSVRHLSLSWVSPIQFIYQHFTTWRSILILFTHLHLGLPGGLFASGFPTKTLYTPSPHPYPPHFPAHPILLGVMISVYCKMHEDIVLFFKMERGLVACNDTDGLMQTLNINHNPLDWRLFTDSSNLSLKAVPSSSKCSLFHNSNVFGSCIIHTLCTECVKIKKIIPAPKG
jgi:hypothetical protein